MSQIRPLFVLFMLATINNGKSFGQEPLLQDQNSRPKDQHEVGANASKSASGAFPSATSSFPSELRVILSKEDHSTWVKDNALSLVSLFVALSGIWVPYLIHRQSAKHSANELELKEVREKLDSFYRPCHQLLQTSKCLYDVLRSRQPSPDKFRTLTELLQGKKFSGNDEALLRQIIDVCQCVENLIIQKAGMVDPSLQDLFANAVTHFRILRLAHTGAIAGEPDKFASYVYPRDLNKAISDKIAELEENVLHLKHR